MTGSRKTRKIGKTGDGIVAIPCTVQMYYVHCIGFGFRVISMATRSCIWLSCDLQFAIWNLEL